MGVDSVRVSGPVTTAGAPRINRAPAAPQDPVVSGDSVRLQGAASAADASQVRTLEGQAFFNTGSASGGEGGHPELNRTLDAVVASIRTLPADKQQALLADPNFTIEIEGRASNLGSDKNFDNIGLSRKRAQNTADYVRSYLKQKGLDVPASAVKATAGGPPGKAKPANDNARADRSAKLKVTLPGLAPLPPSAQVAPSEPRPTPQFGPADPTTEPEPRDAAPQVTSPDAVADPPAAPAEPSKAETALSRFNQTTQPIDGALTKAGADTTTLADREAAVSEAQAALKSAAALLPELDPVAQPGAQALLNGLGEKTARLADRATRERGSLFQLQAQLKAESDEILKAAEGKNKGKLKDLAVALREKYKTPDAIGKDLPSDARKALGKSISELRHTIYEAIARNSDDSKVDQVDNSYMFGRPGPKFKKAWSALKEILASSAPPSAEQRTKAINALKDMGDAVEDFDDPLAKEASQAIYDEITTAVTSKLATT